MEEGEVFNVMGYTHDQLLSLLQYALLVLDRFFHVFDQFLIVGCQLKECVVVGHAAEKLLDLLVSDGLLHGREGVDLYRANVGVGEDLHQTAHTVQGFRSVVGSSPQLA